MTEHTDHNEPAKTVLPGGKKQPKKWQVAMAGYWKAIIAVGGFALILLNTVVGLQVWSETTQQWISTAIAGLVALGVFVKANQGKVEKLTGIDIDQDNVEG